MRKRGRSFPPGVVYYIQKGENAPVIDLRRKERNALQVLEFAVLDGIRSVLRCDLMDVLMTAVSAICNHGEV